MATSPDHPDLQFVQAKKYAPGRPDGPPLWIVVHDMEASETSTRAENTAQYFATLNDGRSVSSHYCCDSDSVVQCVRLGDVAYTVGNRPGNYRGINWEFAGFAQQTREQWLDPFGKAMFAQAAPYIRADARKYGIPLVKRTVAELKAYKPGVTSHNDLREAFGNTTHTDPGPNFPWDYFMALLQEDDVTPEQERLLRNAETYAWKAAVGEDPITGITGGDGKPVDPFVNVPHQQRLEILTKLDRVLELIEAGGLVPHTHTFDAPEGESGPAVPE